MQTLNDLFEDLLRDVYYAEKTIVTALPKMAKQAGSKELSQAFLSHLEETKGQVDRIEQVFEMIGTTPKAKKCFAIEGLVKEAEDAMSESENKPLLDTALVADAQAVEHYEMARYGALIAWAKQLKMPDAAKLLQQTLDQEKAADQKLSKLSTEINQHAEAA